jgi:hypothetical protein
MTPTEARQGLNKWWVSLPVLYKVLTAVAAALVALGNIAATVVRISSVPERVIAIEAWKDSTASPAIWFLVCSQRAENKGEDPKRCEAVLEGVGELLRTPR